ncbi:hypothetical protein HMI54_011892, partial [Coelomomyces lativittatus]
MFLSRKRGYSLFSLSHLLFLLFLSASFFFHASAQNENGSPTTVIREPPPPKAIDISMKPPPVVSENNIITSETGKDGFQGQPPTLTPEAEAVKVSVESGLKVDSPELSLVPPPILPFPDLSNSKSENVVTTSSEIGKPANSRAPRLLEDPPKVVNTENVLVKVTPEIPKIPSDNTVFPTQISTATKPVAPVPIRKPSAPRNSVRNEVFPALPQITTSGRNPPNFLSLPQFVQQSPSTITLSPPSIATSPSSPVPPPPPAPPSSVSNSSPVDKKAVIKEAQTASVSLANDSNIDLTKDENSTKATTIIAATAASSVILFSGLTGIYFFYRRKKTVTKAASFSSSSSLMEPISLSIEQEIFDVFIPYVPELEDELKLSVGDQ